MATVYVRSTDGNDADDGSTWALADATLAASVVAAGAGGRSYVSDAHAESTAGAVTIANPGTAASPNEIICGDDAAEPPTAVATTGSVATTGNNAITLSGFAYIYGLLFHTGVGAGGAANLNLLIGAVPGALRFDNCTLRIGTTNVNTFIAVGLQSANLDDTLVELINTICHFNGATTGLRVFGRLRWRGGSVAGTVPTTALFSVAGGAGPGPDVIVDGVDLSALGSGKSLVNVADGITGRYVFRNCKLGSSVSITTGTHAGPGGIEVLLVNCDSGDVNYRYYKNCYEGEIFSDTANFRTGGASDGTTPISRRMVSSANTKFFQPLVSDPIYVWVETPGSYTATIEVITAGVTLTNAEAWAEVEYPGTSGFPQSLFASDRSADILATPANQTSSSVGWTEALASEVKQKFEVAFTTQEKGPIAVRVYLAKASTTMYFCPKVDVA
jgi:hypothetical protein